MGKTTRQKEINCNSRWYFYPFPLLKLVSSTFSYLSIFFFSLQVLLFRNEIGYFSREQIMVDFNKADQFAQARVVSDKEWGGLERKTNKQKTKEITIKIRECNICFTVFFF